MNAFLLTKLQEKMTFFKNEKSRFYFQVQPHGSGLHNCKNKEHCQAVLYPSTVEIKWNNWDRIRHKLEVE